MAKAEFDRVSAALADDPKTIFNARRELHLDALYGIAHHDAPSLAATPAWNGADGFDPVFAAIANHRNTWAALNDAAGEGDGVARAHLSLDTSPETMAETERRRDAADLADFAAWDAVIAARPSTPAGVRERLAHIPRDFATKVARSGALRKAAMTATTLFPPFVAPSKTGPKPTGAKLPFSRSTSFRRLSSSARRISARSCPY